MSRETRLPMAAFRRGPALGGTSPGRPVGALRAVSEALLNILDGDPEALQVLGRVVQRRINRSAELLVAVEDQLHENSQVLPASGDHICGRPIVQFLADRMTAKKEAMLHRPGWI